MPYKDPEKQREWIRRYRGANRDKLNERRRARDPAKRRASDTKYHAGNPDRYLRGAHGPDIAVVFAAMWEAQQGRCYLCEKDLVPDEVNIDHDYRCCPYGKSCSYCRRGLACGHCNRLIGHAQDDPGLLELIARNLRAKLAETDARLAAKPEQMML